MRMSSVLPGFLGRWLLSFISEKPETKMSADGPAYYITVKTLSVPEERRSLYLRDADLSRLGLTQLWTLLNFKASTSITTGPLPESSGLWNLSTGMVTETKD